MEVSGSLCTETQLYMLSFEKLSEEIRVLENHFAERLADYADHRELSAIFIQIKSLKQQLGITCHSQLTNSTITEKHAEVDVQGLFNIA